MSNHDLSTTTNLKAFTANRGGQPAGVSRRHERRVSYERCERRRGWRCARADVRGVFALQDLCCHLPLTHLPLDLHLAFSWILLELLLEVGKQKSHSARRTFLISP